MKTEEENKKKVTFDPDKAFLSLPIVRYTLSFILLSVAASICTIAINDTLYFSFNSDGFNSAANIFRVPIGLFTLSIPALALLAANHRSEQTKQQMTLTRNQIARTDRQIEIAAGQNVFSNYFKHLEEFEKRFNKGSNKGGMHISNPHKLHSAMFPRARKGELSVDPDFYRTFSGNVTSFINACTDLSNAMPGGKWEQLAFYLSTQMRKISEEYQLNVGITSGMQVSTGGNNKEAFILIDGNLRAFIAHFIEIFAYIDGVMAFDQNYEAPNRLQKLLKLDLNGVPNATYMSNRDYRFSFEKLLYMPTPQQLG